MQLQKYALRTFHSPKPGRPARRDSCISEEPAQPQKCMLRALRCVLQKSELQIYCCIERMQIASPPAVRQPRKSKDRESSEEEFELEYHTLKKLKMPINRKKLSRGNWTLAENAIYLSFLKQHIPHFLNEAVRRQARVFCKLSEALAKKRTPDQCRSHHQKLLNKHHESLEGIVRELERKIRLNGSKEQPHFRTRVIGKYIASKNRRLEEIAQQCSTRERAESDSERPCLPLAEVPTVQTPPPFCLLALPHSGKIRIEIQLDCILSF